MKLSVVFPVLGQFPLARTAIEFAISNLSGEIETEIIVLDNGSEPAFPFYKSKSGEFLVPIPKDITPFMIGDGEIPQDAPKDSVAKLYVIRLDKNIGVYPTFWKAMQYAEGDIVAFFHSDLIISEKGWDKRVVSQFERNKKLGLLGFIGSNEIDAAGGRGLGTTSNFLGDEFRSKEEDGKEFTWHGSHGAVHGKVSREYSDAAVVDGCAMIFRATVLDDIEERKDFPPHHFYDRLLSCEVAEKGYDVGVLGIECDHISGQTVNNNEGNAYGEMAQAWCEAHDIPLGPAQNWDSAIYLEAEKQWLSEYRDIKHFIPRRV